MKKLLLVLVCLFFVGAMFGQTVVVGAGTNNVGAGLPTGFCGPGDTYTDNTTNLFYYCRASTWTAIAVSGSGGTGTVTMFSAGNFSPLFNTSVANSTTSPVLSFSAQTAAAGTLFGNFTGGAAAPSFVAFSPGASKCYINDTNGTLACDTPPGQGTVTTFSSGNLSPLFTTSVSNPTTTPSQTFTLSNAAAGTIFGNFTGSSAAPTFKTFSPGAGKCYINDTNGSLACDTPPGSSFPDSTNWTFANPVLTAATTTAQLNLSAANSTTGLQIPYGSSTSFAPPTVASGIATDQITNQINFYDGVTNHYLANVDYLSASPTTNGILVQAVQTNLPPALSTVLLAAGDTTDITITNPDGTAGNPTITSTVTGVTAGTYNCATITVNIYGKLSAASTGSCGGGGGGNTTSTSLVTGNLPVANGANSIIDSGIGAASGVLTFKGSSSGTISLTPNSTATLLTFSGSGAVTLVTPAGSASTNAIGTAANTGINFLSNSLNFASSGSNLFTAGANVVKCTGACNWSGNAFGNQEIFQSGIDTATGGNTGGAAIFKSASITSGTTTASATGTATFQSGDNSATGGTVQTIGNATFNAGGFLGASGAATGWVPGYTRIGQWYWADTTTTLGTLACITTAGTNGQMPKAGTCTTGTNPSWIGIIESKTGQSIFVVRRGTTTGVLSNASATDTAGYFVCLDTSNAGKVIVQSTPCPSGQAVGTIAQTGSGGTTHTVDVIDPVVVTTSGGVTSFTGDGNLITNSASAGAVTVTLHTAAAHSYFGNNTGSAAAPAYLTIAAADLPAALSSSTSVNGTTIPSSSTLPTTGTLVNGNLVKATGAGALADSTVAVTSLCTTSSCSANTTGTAANLSGTPALPNGTTATTQTAFDGTAKLATDAYVDTEVQALYSNASTGLATSTSTGILTTVSGTGCSSGVCTMTTVGAAGPQTFRVNAQAILTTAGVGCTSGSIQVQFNWTDPDSNTVYSSEPITFTTASSSATNVTSITANTAAIGPNTNWIANSKQFRAKGSTTIQYQVNQTAAEQGCSVLPSFAIRVALFGPLGY